MPAGLRFLSRRKAIYIIIIIILIIFVVLPAYIAYASLHPSRCDSTATPADYGLSYTDAKVETADGITLKGWVIEPKYSEKEPVIIIMHGYTSCKASEGLLTIASELAQRGYRIVMFDFRGHGESGGDSTTIGLLEAQYDAPAIIAYTAESYPGRPIVLLGYSMGGVVAIVAGASSDHVDAIIADSPYPVLEEVIPRWLKAKMGIPKWYSKIIGFYGSLMAGASLDFGPLNLEAVNKPLLVIVGTKDPLVTPSEAREIASKRPHGETIIVEGADHVEAAEVMGIERYVNAIEEFIETSTSSIHPITTTLTMIS